MGLFSFMDDHPWLTLGALYMLDEKLKKEHLDSDLSPEELEDWDLDDDLGDDDLWEDE